jgi:hypothetical protein
MVSRIYLYENRKFIWVDGDTNNDQFCEMEFQISSFALIALKNHDITLICENVKFLTNL